MFKELHHRTFCENCFFLSGFSFTDTDDSQDSRWRDGTIFIHLFHFYPLTNIQKNLLATLHVSWLLHIFNCTTCIYQIATRWDLPLYWITIWLIYDILLNFVRFLDDLFLVFLLQQLTWKTDGFDKKMLFPFLVYFHPKEH